MPSHKPDEGEFDAGVSEDASRRDLDELFQMAAELLQQLKAGQTNGEGLSRQG
jgi:hypothetical protein